MAAIYGPPTRAYGAADTGLGCTMRSNAKLLRTVNANAFLWVTAAVALGFTACRKETPSEPAAAPPTQAAKIPEVELKFVFGSEKKDWLTKELELFNAAGKKTPAGANIKVTGFARGSGEAVADIVSGAVQADVFSPASSMYIAVLNDAWSTQAGALRGSTGLVDDGKSLVVTPVVIGLWKPMATALGWPAKPIGWAELLVLAQDPKGWATLGHAEWGHFKFGHTHPELSNSGHLGVLAEAYAATGLTRGLTPALVHDPKTLDYLRKIEGAVVHYGKSTGFFAEKMMTGGPRYLSAAVLYENLVVQSYLKPEYQNREADLVAIYPKEGTFWIDNPFLVLKGPWVTDEKRAAARLLQDELLSKAAQERAMTGFGFRPADPSVAMASPLDAAHGVDPQQPQTLLELPPAETLSAVLTAWKQTKKATDVYFVFDKSGSMAGEPMTQARAGAQQFLSMLDDRDAISLVLFDHRVPETIGAATELSKGRAAARERLEGTFAEGGTALYDAVNAAFKVATAAAEKTTGRNHALVVMTDGRDEHSATQLDALQATLSKSAEIESKVRIFTVAYGKGADPEILARIAEAGRGGAFVGDPKTIRQVYQDLAAFF